MRFSPGCRCCGEACNLYTLSDEPSLTDLTVISGSWDVVDSQIVCTAAGELQSATELPAKGYAAILARASDPAGQVAIKLANDDHEIVLTVTFGEYGVDDAGTLSITVDGVEKYVTLPQTSDIAHGTDIDRMIMLQCIWTADSVRVEVGLAANAHGTLQFVGIGNRVPIDWLPNTLTLVSDPLAGEVLIDEVVIDRLETDDEACILVTDCFQRYRVPDTSIPRSIGSIIGRWIYDWWEPNRYVEDADVVGDPDADPPEIFEVQPHLISITEDMRAFGYKAGCVTTRGGVVGKIGERVLLATLIVDGGAHEVRWYGTRTVFFPAAFTWELEAWRGATHLQTSSPVAGAGLGTIWSDTQISIQAWLGGGRLQATLAGVSLIDVATTTDYGGHWVRAVAAPGNTYFQWEGVNAFACEGPPE